MTTPKPLCNSMLISAETLVSFMGQENFDKFIEHVVDRSKWEGFIPVRADDAIYFKVVWGSDKSIMTTEQLRKHEGKVTLKGWGTGKSARTTIQGS